jgi:hypothetical protein
MRTLLFEHADVDALVSGRDDDAGAE